MLLSEFEYLAMLALGPDEPVPDMVLLQGITIERLTDAIMGLYGDRSIRSTLVFLAEKNFIQVIPQEGRPNDYAFCMGNLCDAIETHAKTPSTPDKTPRSAAKKPGSSLEESLQTLQTSPDISAREAESKSETDSRIRTSINLEHLEVPVTAEDIHHSSLPPNSETGPPAWESDDGPAQLHERNLIKAIERVAKESNITQRRLSQPTKQRLKRTDEAKRREGQEEFESWRALLYLTCTGYAADPSLGTLDQALRGVMSISAWPKRDHRPTGAVTANGPPPPAGACQNLVTRLITSAGMRLEGTIPAWKWATLEACWFKDRDAFIDRGADHFADCAGLQMTGAGALEAFIDKEKVVNRPKSKNEITPEEFAKFMEENA